MLTYTGGDLSCSCKDMALALILMALLTSLTRSPPTPRYASATPSP